MTATEGPVSRHWTAQRLRLHYLDWGNEGAPMLLLLHGSADHARSWDRVARELRADWHVIAPDLRGHGDSDWSADGAYPMAHYAYDIGELIARTGPLAIVAHSLGGGIALRHAALFPETVTQLVAIEGLGQSPAVLAERNARPFTTQWRKWTERRRALLARPVRRFDTIEQAEARLRARNAHFPDALIRHLTTHGLTCLEGGGYRWKRDPLVASRMPTDLDGVELVALWRAIACPTLLLYGADSWASNPAEDGRAAHFRDGRVSVLPDAGHWPHHDRHDLFMAELRGFLDPAARAPT